MNVAERAGANRNEPRSCRRPHGPAGAEAAGSGRLPVSIRPARARPARASGGRIPNAKEPPTVVSAALDRGGGSDDADVLRFVALLAGSDVEFDALHLVERLVALSADVRVVDEDVVTRLARDEAVTLVRIEELDRA
jgi:hypothetical protein